MRRLSICADSDGFLSNFAAGALQIIHEVTDRRFSIEDITEFNIGRALGLTAQENVAYKKLIGSRRGFAAGLAPYPGARQAIRSLRTFGRIFCVTSPWDSNPWWREERAAWLALHFGIDEVHHDINKAKYDADVFIDDRDEHVAAWLAMHPGCCAVHWQTLHNRTEVTPQGAHATGSWSRLFEIVREESMRMTSVAEVMQ